MVSSLDISRGYKCTCPLMTILIMYDGLRYEGTSISTYGNLAMLLNEEENVTLLGALVCVFASVLQKEDDEKPPFDYIFGSDLCIFDGIICSSGCTLGQGVGLNLRLLNGLSLIHPALLYYFYTVFLISDNINVQKGDMLLPRGVYFTKNIFIAVPVALSTILGS
jgi:hypothetical protein